MSGLYRLHLGDETALVMPPHYSSKKNKSAEGHRDIRAQSRNSATGLEYLSVVLLNGREDEVAQRPLMSSSILAVFLIRGNPDRARPHVSSGIHTGRYCAREVTSEGYPVIVVRTVPNPTSRSVNLPGPHTVTDN
jgi:hypothetical protein